MAPHALQSGTQQLPMDALQAPMRMAPHAEQGGGALPKDSIAEAVKKLLELDEGDRHAALGSLSEYTTWASSPGPSRTNPKTGSSGSGDSASDETCTGGGSVIQREDRSSGCTTESDASSADSRSDADQLRANFEKVPCPQFIPMPPGFERQPAHYGHTAASAVLPASNAAGMIPSSIAMNQIAASSQQVWKSTNVLHAAIANLRTATNNFHQQYQAAHLQQQMPSPDAMALNAINQQHEEELARAATQAATVAAVRSLLKFMGYLQVAFPMSTPSLVQQQIEKLQQSNELLKQLGKSQLPQGATNGAAAQGIDDPQRSEVVNLEKLLGCLVDHQKATLSTINGTYIKESPQQDAAAKLLQPPPELEAASSIAYAPPRNTFNNRSRAGPQRTKSVAQDHHVMRSVSPPLHLQYGGDGGARPGDPRAGAEESAEDTLRAHLQLLQSKDPECVVIVRKINRLGISSPAILRRHFDLRGPVDSVLVAHSCVRSHNRNFPSRLRPSGLGFVVMERKEDAKKMLAEGETQCLNGISILLSKFTSTPSMLGARDCFDGVGVCSPPSGCYDQP